MVALMVSPPPLDSQHTWHTLWRIWRFGRRPTRFVGWHHLAWQQPWWTRHPDRHSHLRSSLTVHQPQQPMGLTDGTALTLYHYPAHHYHSALYPAAHTFVGHY